MQDFEKHLVKAVAKLAPWLAPFPSTYFVGRSAMAHLALPWWVAVVVAAIIERRAGPRYTQRCGPTTLYAVRPTFQLYWWSARNSRWRTEARTEGPQMLRARG
jgi:hypothetical protein